MTDQDLTTERQIAFTTSKAAVYGNAFRANWMKLFLDLASKVRRLALTYRLQTPNYWCPLKPHLRVPVIHWLPHPLERAVVMRRAYGFFPRATSVEEASRFLADSSLFDAPSMAALFPDARIVRGRFGPFTKSLIAILAPTVPVARST